MKKAKELILLGLVVLATTATAAAEPNLHDVQIILASKEFVDLTHSFEPGIPRWPGFPDEKRETAYWYEKGKGSLGTGSFTEIFTHVGQWGTHVDPPAHFIKGLRTVDQISLKEMILPLVVIDVHGEAEKNPVATSKEDYSLETCILKTNHYQIELLTNLDQVPESGALIVAMFPKPKGGSGFPARVFAICPP
jgi:kynurenine formamidase